MSNYGYTFYFKDGSDVLTLPITPGEISVKVGSNNKVITLISEGDINILKSPSLAEIEFEARFPMRKYPFSRDPLNFEAYYEKFMDLKNNKRPFRFIVVRNTNSANQSYGINYLVSLEDISLVEDANEGDDVLVTFNLKQYKEYGVKTLPNNYLKTTTSTSNKPRSNEGKGAKSSVYTVKSGDCLWNIAKAAYGNGAKYTTIYNTNKSAIEADAKKHGKASSSNGHWIWPGLKLTIPGINNASSLKVTKLW